MRVIGFDPGSAITGYCVLDDDKIVEAGIIRLGNTDPLAYRLATLMVEADEIVDLFKAEVVGVESPFVGKFPGAAAALSGARGVLMAVSAYRDARVVSLSPSEVKASTGASGRAAKSQIQLLMQQAFNLATPPAEDVADAMAVALAVFRMESSTPTTRPKGRRPGRVPSA